MNESPPSTSVQLFSDVRFPDGALGSMLIRSGRIAGIGAIEAPGVPALSLGGALVLPALVDGHLHLDKTLFGDHWVPHVPCSNGFDLRERIEIERQILRTSAPVDQRASSLVERAVCRGTGYMRTHVDIDPDFGLRNLDVILDIRERYRHAIEIQIVAFPQRGITTVPNMAGLLSEALSSGADCVGGLDPIGIDGDLDGHLDVVFQLAEKFDASIDIHLHDTGLEGLREIHAIATRSRVLGMQGRVAISHAYAIADTDENDLSILITALQEGGVAIMTNAPGTRKCLPISRLITENITVFSGNDNVRDAWRPYGDADMLERAMILGYRTGAMTDEDLRDVFELVTTQGARALGITEFGLRVGADANFVTVQADSIPETVVARPWRTAVYHRGLKVADHLRFHSSASETI